MFWWIIGGWIASGAIFPVLWLLSMVRRAVFGRDMEAQQRQVDSPPVAASARRSSCGSRGLASSLSMWVFGLPGRRLGGTRTTPKASLIGECVLSGVISFGALILLFVGSFSDSSVTVRDMPLASAVPQARMTRVSMTEAMAETRPVEVLASETLASAKSTEGDTAGEVGMARPDSPREPPSLGEAEHVASVQPKTGNVGDSTGDDVGRQTSEATPLVSNVETLLMAPNDRRLPVGSRGSGHRRIHGPSIRSYVVPSSRGTWLFPPAQNAGGNS
jgi:hypothetical protein